jgi:hypothetical protein
MRRGWWAMMLVLGCGISSSIDGSVSAEIDEFDAMWTMTPTRCVSGEHAGFFGVDLIAGDDAETLVRVVQDPITGASFLTNVPGTDRSVVVDASAGCELFDVEVVRENSRVNNYWNVAGHALLECASPGFSLRVDLNFSGCH